jgi:protease IV
MPKSPTAAVGALARRRTAPIILELDLTDGVVETAPSDPLGRAMTRRRVVLRHVVEGLRAATRDGRVRGLVVKVGGRRLGMATAQELREAIARFRSSGRWAIGWSESFGEFGPGNMPYYVATACDEVWLLPVGTLGLVGVGADVTFLRGALDKAGVRMQVGQRHEYKNAANVVTERDFTPAHHEAAQRVAESAYGQLTRDVAAGRRIGEDAVRDAIDAAPLLASEALRRGLVDRLGYRDEVYDEARRRAGEDATLQFVDRYRKHAERPRPVHRVTRRREPVVALVHGVGGIALGRSRRSPVNGPTMGSETVSSALRHAAEDDAVRAVVLRVDSPGGSAVASDVVWRAVLTTKRAGKPVVVSMGDVAASGGYYVSMAADAIVADAATLTGSIGVLGGKPVLGELLERIGVTTGAIRVGRHSGMFSTRHAYSDEEWQRVQDYLDGVYDDFTAKVADGRGMSRAQVHEIARGRVWTGGDALDRGLVDHLGGLELAVSLARDMARLPADRSVVREYPKLSLRQRVRPPTSSDDAAAASGTAVVDAWGPVAALAARLGLPDAGPLVMPPVPMPV